MSMCVQMWGNFVSDIRTTGTQRNPPSYRDNFTCGKETTMVGAQRFYKLGSDRLGARSAAGGAARELQFAHGEPTGTACDREGERALAFQSACGCGRELVTDLLCDRVIFVYRFVCYLL